MTSSTIAYNLNKNCPITVTFDTLITETIGYRKLVSFSHLSYLVKLSCLGICANPVNH